MGRRRKKTVVHKEVLLDATLELLGADRLAHSKSKAIAIDATLGGGGHASELVKKGFFVLGIDFDQEMLKFARENLEKACPDSNRKVTVSEETTSASPGPHKGLENCFKIVQGNFRNIDKIARSQNVESVDVILFDLGTSLYQLTSRERGFSFSDSSAPLDMRLDPVLQAVTAADLLNSLPIKMLVKLFNEVVDLKFAVRIAQEVSLQREKRRFETVGDLKQLFIQPRLQGMTRNMKLHPVTLPFLALRIAVNGELENLKDALPKAFELLKRGGRMAVISFHSGEDRVVKEYFKSKSRLGLGQILTKKPVTPEKSEIGINPSARSAKLRVIERS